jgi:signal transduction histidine kinase
MRGSLLGKLRNRLLLINLISLSVIMAVALFVIFFITYNRYQSDIDARLDAIPASVVENAYLAEDASTNMKIEMPEEDGDVQVTGGGNLPVDYSKSFVINVTQGGKLSVFSMIELNDKEYVKAATEAIEGGGERGKLTIKDRKWEYRLQACTDLSAGYMTSIVFVDIEESAKTMAGLLISMIIAGVVGIVIIFFVSCLFANKAMRPVEESMEKQRRFVADASHELKTPLAIIDANAEAAKNSDDPDKWIGRIEEESVRMNKLIESLLYLARTEDAKPETLPFDLVSVVSGEIGRVEAVLFEKGIELRLYGEDESIIVNSDKEKIQQAILILLDNAVKYTGTGGHVDVSVQKNDKFGVVSIVNSGAYIEPTDLRKLFDRFYRADESRSQNAGSYGLGLSIAKTIAGRLGASLSASSTKLISEEGGALNTFVLKIPM